MYVSGCVCVLGGVFVCVSVCVYVRICVGLMLVMWSVPAGCQVRGHG